MALILLIFLLVVGFGGSHVKAPTPASKPPTAQAPTKAPDPPVATSAPIDANSIQVVINKKRPLPDGFVPGDLSGALRKEAGGQLTSLFAGAQGAGHGLKLISGYRSQAAQKNLYDSYVKRDGVAAADRYSARPRHSEHQTGLGVDVGDGTCDLEICFGGTPAGQWLAAHAHEYGFIIRYGDGQESITGYQYEPWHLRYVGTDLAGKIKQSGKTLEQHFDLPAAPGY